MHNLNLDRLDHLVLTVRDVDQTCAFYQRVLGMEIETFGRGRTALRFGRHKINVEHADRPTPIHLDDPDQNSIEVSTYPALRP